MIKTLRFCESRASLVPSLVLNAVVTCGGLCLGSRRSRLEECPFARPGLPSAGKERTMAKKRNKDNKKTSRAVLPVMRADSE